ncbi:MAG: sulfur carrier protein ThiS [Flavobacteriales bacterium]|nr:sulfur carrier protein ThiS [Flavobacteriales bacterium]
MKVYLNDREIQTEENQSLFNFLQSNQLTDRNGIAVALNDMVVPKTDWEQKILEEKDHVMIITATAGG